MPSFATPNIVDQALNAILEAVAFVDRIVFGRLNYNPLITRYPRRNEFYNQLGQELIAFCRQRRIEYHIKAGTLTNKKLAKQTTQKVFV